MERNKKAAIQAGLNLVVDDDFWSRPHVDSIDIDVPKPKGDERWLYVAFYGEDETWRKVLLALEAHLTSAHHLNEQTFLDMITAWQTRRSAAPPAAPQEPAPDPEAQARTQEIITCLRDVCKGTGKTQYRAQLFNPETGLHETVCYCAEDSDGEE